LRKDLGRVAFKNRLRNSLLGEKWGDEEFSRRMLSTKAEIVGALCVGVTWRWTTRILHWMLHGGERGSGRRITRCEERFRLDSLIHFGRKQASCARPWLRIGTLGIDGRRPSWRTIRVALVKKMIPEPQNPVPKSLQVTLALHGPVTWKRFSVQRSYIGQC